MVDNDAEEQGEKRSEHSKKEHPRFRAVCTEGGKVGTQNRNITIHK
jgi:hypothetical protein